MHRFKGPALHVTYAIATATALYMAWFSAQGGPRRLIVGPVGSLAPIQKAASEGGTVGVTVAALVLAYLAIRPVWWGKLVAGLMAVPWLGFGISTASICIAIGGCRIDYAPPICAGLIMLAAVIAHQVLDPSFGSVGRAVMRTWRAPQV